jgi:glucose uptake protein
MYLPSTYSTAIICMFINMVCWGSWANTQKLTKNWRFELFYWDYVWGVLATSILYAFTLGSPEISEPFSVLLSADVLHGFNAVLGGVIFNVANVLLVAAISIAGMAVAFPIGIGIALVFGTLLSYWVAPSGNAVWLMIGVLFILFAIFCDAKAYQKISDIQQKKNPKGLILSISSGLLMGVFYPLVARSMAGDGALDPYSANVFFSTGIALCNLPLNLFIMKRPFVGTPLKCIDYRKGTWSMHLLGWLGGAIWCTGMTLNLIAADLAGPAIAYAFGQGATLIAAIWGVFIWKEFKQAKGVNSLLGCMFASYIFGLMCIGIAKLF